MTHECRGPDRKTTILRFQQGYSNQSQHSAAQSVPTAHFRSPDKTAITRVEQEEAQFFRIEAIKRPTFQERPQQTGFRCGLDNPFDSLRLRVHLLHLPRQPDP